MRCSVNWTTKVPKTISAAIRSFGLPREVVIQLVMRIHSDIPRDYPRFRNFRTEGAERTYRYRMVIKHQNVRHLFTFAVDDCTAQNFLIVEDITHNMRHDS